MTPSSTRPVLHLICQAHLDPVWVWPRRDGFSEALTTMGSAVRFLEEEPDLKFTRSSAAVYRWVRESDPRLYDRIRQFVAEGRWEIVNGWEVQPDANLPLGESFIRQSLYGKQWFAEEFGVDVKIGYNVDTFGHAGNLPQILARSGMDAYVFMRPPVDPEGKPYPVLFWWESPDGSRILTWHLQQNYGQPPSTGGDHIEREIRRAAAENFAPGIQHAACFVGIGNHGGGPTRRQIDRIRRLQEDPDLPELRFSTLTEFFRLVREEPGFSAIPVHREGLQYINVGCYLAHGRIKRANRRAERLLLKSEAMESMRRMCGLKATNEFSSQHVDAWRNVLFGQFHDIMGGTCIRSADTSILNQFGHADFIAESFTERNLHTVARAVDTSWAPKGVLTLFNPLPWKRAATVSFDTFVAPTGEDTITHLRDFEGKKVPIQWTPAEIGFGPMQMEWQCLNASVELPPFGYRSFALAEGRAPSPVDRPLDSIKVNRRRAGLSALKTKAGLNLLRQSIHLKVFRDTGDTWGHRLDAYDEELGEPTLKKTTLLYQGPLKATFRQEARWKESVIRLYYTLWKNRPEVEVRLAIRWNEPRELLRLVVPTSLKNSTVWVGEPGGTARRRQDGWEKPAAEWLAIEGSHDGQSHSLGLVGDRPLSYCAEKGTLGIALVRSSFYAHHEPGDPAPREENPYLDLGEQEIRLWLTAAKGRHSRLQLHRMASEIESPAERVVDHGHPGELPPHQSLLEVSPPSVAVMALKPSESGRGMVLRIQETTGKNTTASIRSPLSNIPDWKGKLGPHQILTLEFPLRSSAGESRRLNLLEKLDT